MTNSNDPDTCYEAKTRASAANALTRGMVLALTGTFALFGGQIISVEDQRLYLHCSGPRSEVTVILEAGASANSTNYEKVQTRLAESVHVCSYDRAGLGKSDKPSGQMTEARIVENLHQLLMNAHEPGPYLLVGHSLGGIYVRGFETRYPQLVKGMVLVDSSHEDQLNRFTAISPELGRQFATQGGRSTYDDMYRLNGQLHPGETLTWHVDVPLIVIEHKRPEPGIPAGAASPGMPNVEPAWHEMQVDLQHRSSCGQLWEAPKEGHDIPGQQPDLVVQAISKVLGEIRNGCDRSGGGSPH